MHTSVAVIGLRHGERHVHGFLAAGASKVYAVDINTDLYERVQDDRVETSDDYHAVMSSADIIVISLPPFLHREALETALQTSAKRIWIEKPLLDIGEDPDDLTADNRVEVIHELRRSTVVREWERGSEQCQEAKLTWRRPVPAQYNQEKYPIGVMHDLGVHLVDLSFALLKTVGMPEIVDTRFTALAASGAQEVEVALRFGDVPVTITAAYVADEAWPDKEITVEATTTNGALSWYGRKSAHRHLTDGADQSDAQIAQEKDWYGVALRDEPTGFAPLSAAIQTQRVCNDAVRIALGRMS